MPADRAPAAAPPEAATVLTLRALADGGPGEGRDWRDVALPASGPPTRLLRLHRDRGTSATVSLVRFPAGWTRPGTGHYLAGEEFVVLDGALRVSGQWHRTGDAVYLPPRVPRWDSACPDGALALAWFSGVPEWHPGEPVDGCVPAPGGYAGAPAPGPLRRPTAYVPGVSDLVDGLGTDPASVGRDVLWLDDAAWAWVPAGTPAPTRPGPALVRTWP